ncbi:60S ribosomal protein L11 [Balamuthia mandrillaris]
MSNAVTLPSLLFFLFFLLFLLPFVFCTTAVRFHYWDDSLLPAGKQVQLQLEFGDNIAVAVKTRIVTLFHDFLSQHQTDYNSKHTTDALITLILSFGNTTTTRSLIPFSELQALGSEAFILRSSSDTSSFLFVADGNHRSDNYSATTAGQKVNIGAHFGSYALLESLGFGFFHPLKPTIPSSLLSSSFFRSSSAHAALNVKEAPRWPMRGLHHHTQHPLEFCEYFNGFDSMYNATTPQPWDSMTAEFTMFLEWMIANRQNSVEWVLLYSDEWKEFAWSELRHHRMKSIINTAHQWGLSVGADCGIVIYQQHGWPLIQNITTPSDIKRQMHRHLDWLFSAGFDFLATESGFTEFTKPSCPEMLSWMNEVVEYSASQWNRAVFIKCHCSTGQTCAEFKDPITGKPLNFNFLPYFADARLGVLPHTVQFYNFTQPAPTYGNRNFKGMLQFLEENLGKRPVVYHGETAYWVNFDIDVPLFLPLFAQSRVEDLRAIATLENHLHNNNEHHKEKKGRRMEGQMNFNSGWEWGYWLNDVVTLRGAWNPLVEEQSTSRGAVKQLLQPLRNAFGEVIGEELVEVLLDVMEVEAHLLVEGSVDGGKTRPSSVEKRNGQAYLQGWDTWSDLTSLVSSNVVTQPNKLGLQSALNPWSNPSYNKEIAPLLEAMALNFTALANRLDGLSASVPSSVQDLFDELRDSIQITASRAVQIYSLYNYAASWYKFDAAYRQAQLQTAQQAITKATAIVRSREAAYRVPVQRIAAWRKNPTVYHYGYLWTVHSLQYFCKLAFHLFSLPPLY